MSRLAARLFFCGVPAVAIAACGTALHPSIGLVLGGCAFGLGWQVTAPCRHMFHIKSLRMVNRDSDGEDRVEWPCQRCGEVFTAHCGLDIVPKHGYITTTPTSPDPDQARGKGVAGG